MFKLESSDNQSFLVSEKVLLQSEVCTNLMEMTSSDDAIPTIPVPAVDGETLKKIVEFCQHFENDSPYVPPTTSDPAPQVPPQDSWEMKFLLNMPYDLLTKIIHGANFLNIPRLIDYCCFRLAIMIQGRSVGDIRRIFEIENDFTADEEQLMKNEHLWYEANAGQPEPH
ncbi:hypothetical protein FO519_000872 [Halicephalobus sp. NKZ332]|nr:hypothetical protein FO519_000872 [Halicephalobus sp. NKZ332]